MGAEHSQQRVVADGHDVYEGRNGRVFTHDHRQLNQSFRVGNDPIANSISLKAAAAAANKRRSTRPNSAVNNPGIGTPSKQTVSDAGSLVNSELSRPPSPPLSVCSDLPYVSYMDRPIGDSPKIRNKHTSDLQKNTNRAAARKSYPSSVKPKRPQSTASSHSIVIVKPGARDNELDIDPDLGRLCTIPQFMPVLQESISSSTQSRDVEVLERLQSLHLLNIASRMQTHLNLCATHITNEQNHLVERTKVVSNSITTLFAVFVDMQKTYAAYAEQFAKIRVVSQQLSRCNSILHDNMASLVAINNFLDQEDRLDPFVWHTENMLRGDVEAVADSSSGHKRHLERIN